MSLVRIDFAGPDEVRLVFDLHYTGDYHLCERPFDFGKRIAERGEFIAVPSLGATIRPYWNEMSKRVEASIPMKPEYDVWNESQMKQLADALNAAYSNRITRLCELARDLEIIQGEAES